MTIQDVEAIERALGVTLPDAYKRAVVPFPIRHLQGNSADGVWDDAAALIARNLELRTEWVTGFQPWPWHWYFLGDALSACGYAIDLSDTSFPVVWCDHCDLLEMQGGWGTPFDRWWPEWLVVMADDLRLTGIDPEDDPPSPPEPWPAWKWWLAKAALLALLAIGVIGVALRIRDWLG